MTLSVTQAMQDNELERFWNEVTAVHWHFPGRSNWRKSRKAQPRQSFPGRDTNTKLST